MEKNDAQLAIAMLLNIQGMNPTCHNQAYKIKALSEIIKNCPNFVPYIAITESHLNEGIFNAEVHLENYNIYRSDRVDRKSGGAAIYMHEEVIVNTQETYSDSICEAVMLKNNHLNFILISLYKPPDAINIDLSFKKCTEKIDDFIKNFGEGSDITIMGDFNLPNINWNTLEIKKSRSSQEKNCAKTLLNLMDKHLLVQIVTETTRKDKNTLDLILTNNQEPIHSIVVEKISLSDHDIVHVSMLNCFSNNPTDIKIEEDPFKSFNLYKANWIDIEKELDNFDWETLFNEASVDEMVDILEEKVLDTLKTHAPLKKKLHPKDIRMSLEIEIY